MTNAKSQPKDAQLEGEGSRKADRHYREAATHHAQSGDKSKQAAEQAKRALDEEGDELASAEREGKAGHPRTAAE